MMTITEDIFLHTLLLLLPTVEFKKVKVNIAWMQTELICNKIPNYFVLEKLEFIIGQN